jgi:hypothetical protein
MHKKELYSLMALIQVYYDKFHFDQQKLDAWHVVLQKYSYDGMNANLLKFVIESPHPPKICDLVQNASLGRDIPREFVLDLTAGEDW